MSEPGPTPSTPTDLDGLTKVERVKAASNHLRGCGDQERNVMCCPAPQSDRFHDEVSSFLSDLVPALTPVTRAYHEIWIDGALESSGQPPDEVEDLYGERYLPRKFKTAIALE